MVCPLAHIDSNMLRVQARVGVLSLIMPDRSEKDIYVVGEIPRGQFGRRCQRTQRHLATSATSGTIERGSCTRNFFMDSVRPKKVCNN